jgi:hypothetical protein
MAFAHAHETAKILALYFMTFAKGGAFELTGAYFGNVMGQMGPHRIFHTDFGPQMFQMFVFVCLSGVAHGVVPR